MDFRRCGVVASKARTTLELGGGLGGLHAADTDDTFVQLICVPGTWCNRRLGRARVHKENVR